MQDNGMAVAGSFCWNPLCCEFGKAGSGNVRRFGWTRKGTQRLQCKRCRKTFTQTKGTLFHRCHHPPQTIIGCLALLAERNSLAAVSRVKGIKEETLSDWLAKASEHVQEIEALLLSNHRLTRVQLDALWTFVGHKGEKGGAPKKSIVALAGAAPPSAATAACGSDEPSP